MGRLKTNTKRIILTQDERTLIYYMLRMIQNDLEDTQKSGVTKKYHVNTTIVIKDEDINIMNELINKI